MTKIYHWNVEFLCLFTFIMNMKGAIEIIYNYFKEKYDRR